MKYIILNFTYGYGPFLRTTELAIAVNDVLEQKTGERFGIIIPWIYGAEQKNIMSEAFANHIKKHPEELVLDKTYGKHLKTVFYGPNTFEDSLQYFFDNGKRIKDAIHRYIKDGMRVETFKDTHVSIPQNKIAFGINRNPRIMLTVCKSYYVSFAYISDILEHALNEEEIDVSKAVIEKVIPLFKEIEDHNELHFIFEPSTFSHQDDAQQARYKNQKTIPPIKRDIKKEEHLDIPNRGVYVTISGISHVTKYYQEIDTLGFSVYSNVPDVIPGSILASPSIMSEKNIVLHIARSGWGSIWHSWRTHTPFMALPYDSNDDPEIFFNNESIQKYGLGEILQQNSLPNIDSFTTKYNKNINRLNKSLLKKYGTLDGKAIITHDIVNDYI